MLLATQIISVQSTLYVGSDLSQSCATYFAKFGRPIRDPDGIIVKAQDLGGNEDLCSNNFDSFRGHAYSSGDHLALVATEDNCTLRQKLFMAEALAIQHPAVSILIVVGSSSLIPTDLDDMILEGQPKHCRGPDDIGCSFRTNMTVLSITKFCGDHLLEYIEEQSTYTLADGGPAVFVLDSAPQQGIKVAVLSVSIALVALFSCSLVVIHAACTPRNAAAGAPSSVPILLTEECVECFSISSTVELIDNTVDDEPPSCAICIEFLEPTHKVAVLPCGHFYHHSCVLPWLTERQASCPLCKYNLQPMKLEDDPASQTSAVPSPMAFSQVLRQHCVRWVQRFRGADHRVESNAEDNTQPYDAFGELELEVEMS
jgi:hypothetical protein